LRLDYKHKTSYMKKILFTTILGLLLISCGSSRKPTETSIIKNSKETVSSKKINKIVTHAKTFQGTKYKFGGTDRSGMDCSGLVYVSFKSEQIILPRVSKEMAAKGFKIKLNESKKGDLIFFKTNPNKNVITHVGLVVENKKGNVRFIHSSSSKGVIISSLQESYWNKAFTQVRRII